MLVTNDKDLAALAREHQPVNRSLVVVVTTCRVLYMTTS